MQSRFALAGVFALLLILIGEPVFSQTQTSTPAPQRDSQAIAVLTQVLTTAGGLPALSAIQDFTGTGNITYYQPQSLTGTVTVRGTQMEQYRLDVAVSTGTRSQSTSNGQWTLKREDGTALSLQLQIPLCPECVAVPYLLLAPAMNSSQYSLIYKGLVGLDGNSVIQVEVQQVIPGLSDLPGDFREYHTLEFFIDSSTYHIVMLQDVVPKHLTRQIRFSGYQNFNGVLLPLRIAEQCGGLQTWTIQLSQISLNSGLQDSDFQL